MRSKQAIGVAKQRGEPAPQRVVPPPKRLNEVSRPDKGKAIARTLLRTVGGVAGLLLAYGFLPLSAATNDELLLRIIVAGVVIVLVLLFVIQHLTGGGLGGHTP